MPTEIDREQVRRLAQVYDYVAGKADWGSAGLPLEGREGSETRAGAHVRTDVPNCRPEERIHDVCARLDESGWDTCSVLDERGVVLGGVRSCFGQATHQPRGARVLDLRSPACSRSSRRST
jgi:hypothetical protein